MMPFPGGLESTANGTLLLSVAAALLYLPTLARPASLRRTAVRTAGVGLLAVLAFETGGPLLLVGALALSAAGDAALAQEDERAFVAGLSCFFLAHIAYIALFLRAGGGAGVFTATPSLVAIGLAVAALAGLMLALLRRRVDPALRLPVAAYGLAVLAMALTALTVPSPWIVLGALTLMASDALFVWQKFLTDDGGGRQPALPVAGWILYYAAQLTITLAVLLYAPQ